MSQRSSIPSNVSTEASTNATAIRLPPNAQRGGAQDQQLSESPLSSSVSRHSSAMPSLARATEILASSASSQRIISPPSQDGRRFSQSPNNEGNGDDPGTPIRSDMILTEQEAARRLKRHLVTRPLSELRGDNGSDTGPRSYGSIGSSVDTSQWPHRSSLIDHDDNDGGYSGDDNDDDEEELVAVDPLTLPSGDITHHIYKWQEEHDRREPSVRNQARRRSLSAVASDSEWDIQFTRNRINVPGGFRRQFLHDRAIREGRSLPPNILTANFVDFIGLYGHFAGGEYPSDEDDPEDDEGEYYAQEEECAEGRGAAGSHEHSERTPLRRRRPASRDIQATASPRKAFFLLVKAFIGTGVLVLPRAFYNGGLLFSTVLMSLIAWYALHCMALLVEVYLKVRGSYGDIGEKLYGRTIKYCVMVSIVLAQLGFCCAYTIFVATNLRNLWNTLTNCKYNFSSEFWVMVQLLAYVPLVMVRKIKNFAPFALVANVFIIFGLGYLFMFDFWTIATDGVAEVVQFNYQRFPLLVGTAVFSFEGISLCIPVVESMKEKQKFPFVLTSSLLFCAVIFVAAGAFSYMTFGDSVESVVLLSLPNDSVWTMGVQLLYSFAILFSVPLQLFPAIRIIEAGLFSKSGKGNPIVKWQKNLFRTLMVFFIAMVAIYGAEQLDNFVAIVGSFACVPLSFIYPSMFHYKAVADNFRTRAKDMFLMVLGVVTLIYVTYISVSSWGSGSPPYDRCAASP